MNARYDGFRDWPTDIPFERVVRARLRVFDDLVHQGVTWPAITAALARAGVTRRDGKPLAWRQVNAVYRRNKRHPIKIKTPDVPALETISPPAEIEVQVPTPPPLPASGGLAARLQEARKFNKIQSREYDE
jgi:hypothetical protein